jgi:hypothetical protein
MIPYNITPFTFTTDDPARLKQMALVKALLKTNYDGNIEHLRTHITEFTRRIQNTGLYHEFTIKTRKNPRPVDIPEDQSTLDHPLRWKTVNFLENFSDLKFKTLVQEREHIDDTLSMLDDAPLTSNDKRAQELASKRQAMWLAELLDNSWSDTAIAEMNAFDEDTK